MPAVIPLDLSYLTNPTADRLDRLGYQLRRRLAGGDVSADSPYTLQECMLALEEYRGKKQAEIELYNADRKVRFALEDQAYRKQQYFDDMEALYKYGGTADQWVKSFNLTVFNDADRGLKYCLLPQQFVNTDRYQNLPAEEGVRVERVKWAANLNFAPRFMPLPGGAAHMMAGLYRGGLQGNYGYFRDSDGLGTASDRVYFYADPTCPAITDTQLRLTMIIRPKRDGLGDPGLMYDVSDADMVMGAEQWLRNRGPEDKVSNNVPAEQPAA